MKAGSTPHYLVKRALDAVGQEKMLGAVLNRTTTETRSGGYDYYYDYYYGSNEAIDPR